MLFPTQFIGKAHGYELDRSSIKGFLATAGIGFTVALFVASLSFDDPDLLRSAKIGILTASTVAGVLGFTLLRRAAGRQPSVETPESSEELPV